MALAYTHGFQAPANWPTHQGWEALCVGVKPSTQPHCRVNAEGKLEAAFRHEAARLCGSGSRCAGGLRYVAFDFHHECSGKRYHRLSLLWDQVGSLGCGL